jgi:hypothetical protein
MRNPIYPAAVACLFAAMTPLNPALARPVPPPQSSSENINIRRIFGMEMDRKLDEEVHPRHHRQFRDQERWRQSSRRHHYRVVFRQRAPRMRTAIAVAPPANQGFSLFGINFYSGPAPVGDEVKLLHVAERYVGRGNFTGFHGKWCAAAAGLWLNEAGYSRLPSLAAVSYAQYGRPSAPKPGVVAVLPHHIGIVAKVYPTSILLLSGNHRHDVGYGVVSKRSVIAFREPI